jgi:hypothetical protein
MNISLSLNLKQKKTNVKKELFPFIAGYFEDKGYRTISSLKFPANEFYEKNKIRQMGIDLLAHNSFEVIIVQFTTKINPGLIGRHIGNLFVCKSLLKDYVESVKNKYNELIWVTKHATKIYCIFPDFEHDCYSWDGWCEKLFAAVCECNNLKIGLLLIKENKENCINSLNSPLDINLPKYYIEERIIV